MVDGSRIIMDHRLFGLGPGAYPYVLYNYYPFMLNDFFGQVFVFFAEASNGVRLVHNIFLVFFLYGDSWSSNDSDITNYLFPNVYLRH